MATLNISDIGSVKEYTKNTNAELKITSVASRLSVEFPAFLTDFSQNFDAQWNSEDVFGRIDPISTYQGTKRTMSLGFEVIAGTQKGAQKNLSRCKDLVKMVYPVYKKNVLSKPPLVRVRFANLIVGSQKAGATSTAATATDVTSQEGLGNVIENATAGNPVDFDESQGEGVATGVAGATSTPAVNNSYVGLLGWIGALSWKPNLEMGMFSDGKAFYPKVISISFTFNVLHEHTPSQGKPNVPSFPFKTK